MNKTITVNGKAVSTINGDYPQETMLKKVFSDLKAIRGRLIFTTIIDDNVVKVFYSNDSIPGSKLREAT